MEISEAETYLSLSISSPKIKTEHALIHVKIIA
jgi:hypothetical protein